MKSKFIFVILFILALIGFFVFIYLNYDMEQVEYSNVSISTLYNEKMIKTGLVVDGKKINSSKVYEVLQLKQGMITIENKNLEEQNFYEVSKQYNISEKNQRIDIELKKPKMPKFELDYEENKVIVKLYEGELKEPKVCLKGSGNYLFLTVENKKRIKKLDSFANYDSCYDLQTEIKGEYSYNVTYEELSNPTERDYINMSLIDSMENFKIVEIL